jgi:hypothetical protein
MLLIVAPVLQPLRTGLKVWRDPAPVIGESESIKEVRLCTQLSKQVVSKFV